MRQRKNRRPRNEKVTRGRDQFVKAELLKSIKCKYTGNSAATQRDCIMAALAVTSLTTVEAVRWLDIVRPGARISELRNDFGEPIVTTWCDELTEAGEIHRVARYVLEPKGGAS